MAHIPDSCLYIMYISHVLLYMLCAAISVMPSAAALLPGYCACVIPGGAVYNMDPMDKAQGMPYATLRHICHAPAHMPRSGTYATARHICHSPAHATARHICHSPAHNDYDTTRHICHSPTHNNYATARHIIIMPKPGTCHSPAHMPQPSTYSAARHIKIMPQPGT
jgi:hypothetical protein